MHEFRDAPALPVETLNDLVTVLQPQRHYIRENRPIAGFAYDSRKVQADQVFVAIRGERVDGHRYVDQAFASGAGAALVESLDGVKHRNRCVVVPDAVRALGYLAASHRRALGTKIIGLTGSVGKTTTKDLLHGLMSTVFRTRKSEGNFNSRVGLPIQLLMLRPEDDWMIAEMGMSYAGEIAELMHMATPDIGLLLSVQAAHLANFDDIEGIAQAKGEMAEHLGSGKLLVYNMDDPRVLAQSARHHGRKLGYGMTHAEAEVRGVVAPFPSWHETHFTLMAGDRRPLDLILPMTGAFNVGNALAACAAALAAGLPGPEMARGLMSAKPSAHRCQLLDMDEDVQLVDDVYNASPHAVYAVLRAFAPLPAWRYRWLILGDMLELGDEEAAIHERLGAEIAGYGFDRVTLVGPLAAHMEKGLRDHLTEVRALKTKVEYFADVDAAIRQMDSAAPGGSRIWAKASRGIGLEKLVDHLAAHHHQTEDAACSTNS